MAKVISPKRKYRLLILVALIQICGLTALGQDSVVIRVNIDASQAARNLLHTSVRIPVKPGPVSFFYPKWIPGEHSPTGPINDLVGLRLTANGQIVAWTRDPVEMFAFRCDVPPGTSELEVAFDDVSQPGTTMSARLARIKWNRMLVYPRGMNSEAVRVDAAIKLPAGWQFATALPVQRERRDEIDFKEVSLTELVDSPMIAGANFRKLTLASTPVLHEMDIAADSPGALDVKPATLQGWQNLVKEANALFGAHHYRSYRFLLTLSDVGGLSYSIGLIVGNDGTVLDVNPDLGAAKAGIAPGMKIVGVNGREWSAAAIHEAIGATKSEAAAPIELRVENGSFQDNYKLSYRGGERYPHLERDTGKSDVLSEIIKPRTR